MYNLILKNIEDLLIMVTSIFKSRHQVLTDIMSDYEKIAQNNPDTLRTSIPSQNMWHFIVSGRFIKEGNNLKDLIKSQIMDNNSWNKKISSLHS